MQEIRCTNDGKLIARLEGDRIELYCPRCKQFHVIKVIDLVRSMIADYQNGHDPAKETSGGLVW